MKLKTFFILVSTFENAATNQSGDRFWSSNKVETISCCNTSAVFKQNQTSKSGPRALPAPDLQLSYIGIPT